MIENSIFLYENKSIHRYCRMSLNALIKRFRLSFAASKTMKSRDSRDLSRNSDMIHSHTRKADIPLSATKFGCPKLEM